MKGADVLFSHKTDEWCTPKWLFDRLNAEFHFDLDAAATQENALAPGYYSKEDNALTEDWYQDYGEDGVVSTVFVNPPHSLVAAFVKKAYHEALKGATVVCLIASRTDTKFWHEYVMRSSEVRFIKGRLKFTNISLAETTSATFPSCVVIFDERMLTRFSYPIMRSIEP